jgi:hypothetical protein
MTFLFALLPLLLWTALWSLGGWLIAISAFRAPRREAWMIGLGLGLTLQAWFANLLSHLLPVPLSFWIGAALTFGLGLIFALPSLRSRQGDKWIPIAGQWLVLAFLIWAFYAIGRGLAIFDDYQNVPTVSLMATGDIPPHFALDPRLSFGYHYLLLLIAAQIMRLGGIAPWNALDFARAVAFGFSLMYIYLWTWRMTRSRVAATLGSIFTAFAGGVRWLLLFLPRSFVETLSGHVTLIGSAEQTVSTLADGMILPWDIDGGGPFPFPFAYANGVNSPSVMVHGGTGLLGLVIVALILLLYRRWRDWRGGVVMTALLASLAMVSESGFLILFANLGIALVAFWLINRKVSLPRSVLAWGIVLATGFVVALFQGGVLTDILRDQLGGPVGRTSYHTFEFGFSWPPSVVSGHLGVLSLGDPYQLLAALLEIGPQILVLPLAIVWGVKMLRAQRWWEAGLIAGIITSLPALFIQYSGTAGITANIRLLNGLLLPTLLYAVPLLWIWAKRRSEKARVGVLLAGLISVFGGLMLFGIELVAAQKPIFPTFIHEMDAQMLEAHWNQLEPGVLVFDPYPTRAVTVFGRYTDSNETWYVPKSEWDKLAAAPDPFALHAAGFDYIYFGIEYWENLPPAYQSALQATCVRLVDERTGYRSEKDYRKSFRRLLDIRACE